MSSFLFFIVGILLFCILLLNILSLPANWLIVCFFIILYILPQFILSFQSLLTIIGIALIAEILEFGLQMLIAKQYGASRIGNWAGICGSFIGAIIGIPFLLGLGALIGALIGAWLACYIAERIQGHRNEVASKIAFGVLRGKLLGFSIKIALGAYIIIYGIQNTYLRLEYPTQQEYNIIQYTIDR